jgi:S-adenosylmethionine:tRNA-ribosyltransferase-isomerase (queuine synthetase)
LCRVRRLKTNVYVWPVPCQSHSPSDRHASCDAAPKRLYRAGVASAWSGPTDLFIKPGFSFRAVTCLLTNFHMPRTTLLVLVSTFASRELIQRAYAEAIRERYRFLSYGDAMLLM